MLIFIIVVVGVLVIICKYKKQSLIVGDISNRLESVGARLPVRSLLLLAPR